MTFILTIRFFDLNGNLGEWTDCPLIMAKLIIRFEKFTRRKEKNEKNTECLVYLTEKESHIKKKKKTRKIYEKLPLNKRFLLQVSTC